MRSSQVGQQTTAVLRGAGRGALPAHGAFAFDELFHATHAYHNRVNLIRATLTHLVSLLHIPLLLLLLLLPLLPSLHSTPCLCTGVPCLWTGVQLVPFLGCTMLIGAELLAGDSITPSSPLKIFFRNSVSIGTDSSNFWRIGTESTN